MSTFLATMGDLDRAIDLVNELLSNGVSPDSVSVVSKQVFNGSSALKGISETDRLGDATAFPGSPDDPTNHHPLRLEDKLSSLSTGTEFPDTAGIDTSDRASDVESVDQNEDSQSASEDMIYPPKNISQGTHETDDMALTMLTGYPTTPPLEDDVDDRTSSLLDGLQVVAIPDSGTVIGGGALATASLDAINPDHSADFDSLKNYFADEGVPQETGDRYVAALDRGDVLIGVEILPGSTHEEYIEAAARRAEVSEGQLFDAPRFHDFERGDAPYAG
jgi:pentatricopeptide repeat protein